MCGLKLLNGCREISMGCVNERDRRVEITFTHGAKVYFIAPFTSCFLAMYLFAFK